MFPIPKKLFEGNGEFKVERSLLETSSVLEAFFNSPYYLPGCDFTLRFITDPAVCFAIVEKYLVLGPYLYTSINIRGQIDRDYESVDRLIVYAEIHRLAKKLAIRGLKKMAYKSLEDPPTQVTASGCINMARRIFKVNGHFGSAIKIWLRDQIRSHFLPLLENEEWITLLPFLDRELGHHWSNMVAEHEAIVAALDNKSD